MSKSRIIVGTHGRFGEEIIKSAKLILGESELFEAVSLLPEMSLENYLEEADKALSNADENVIVFVDLLGGTPSNVFTILSKKYNYPIVTGVNLPVLLDAYFKANGDDFNAHDEAENFTTVISESSTFIESKF